MNNTKREGGCDRFFDPEIFNQYRIRFKKLIPDFQIAIQDFNDPLVKKWISLIASFDQDCANHEQSRKWHIAFTLDLRELSQALKRSETIVHIALLKIMEEWMFNRFCKLVMNDILENEFIRTYGESNGLGSDLYKRFGSTDLFLKGENISDPFDAILYGNQPFNFPIVQLADGHSVHMMRMASPICDINTQSNKEDPRRIKVTKVGLVEEFKLHLNHLKRAGNRHLYVNLMSRKKGNESLRSRTIEDYSNQKDSNMIVMTLDKNSDFYLQDSSQNQKADEFKEYFLANFLDSSDNSYFFFSNSIDQSWLKTAIRGIINEVHSLMFDGKEIISHTEKVVFIEICYCKMIEQLMEKFHPKTASFSCKQNIDRGIGQIFTFYVYMRNKGLLKISDFNLKAIFFVPSIWVSNRLPFERFYERASHTVNFLDS